MCWTNFLIELHVAVVLVGEYLFRDELCIHSRFPLTRDLMLFSVTWMSDISISVSINVSIVSSE